MQRFFSKTLCNCVGTCQRLPARQQFTANRSRQMGPIDLTRRDSHHRHLECRAVRDLLIGGWKVGYANLCGIAP